MAELTAAALEALLQRQNEAITGLLDRRLDDQTKDLKAYSNDAFEKQQDYLEVRFAEIREELDVTARIHTIEKRLDRIEAQRAH